MSTTIPSPNTETTDDDLVHNLVDITSRGLEFARTRVMRKGKDQHTERFAGKPRPTIRRSLDGGQTISNIEIECPSSAVRGGQESIGEDLSHIPWSDRSLPDGRVAGHSPATGEKEMSRGLLTLLSRLRRATIDHKKTRDQLYDIQTILDLDRDQQARELDDQITKSLSREVVMTLTRDNVVLQNSDYLTEDELEADRELMRKHKFQYLKPQP